MRQPARRPAAAGGDEVPLSTASGMPQPVSPQASPASRQASTRGRQPILRQAVLPQAASQPASGWASPVRATSTSRRPNLPMWRERAAEPASSPELDAEPMPGAEQESTVPPLPGRRADDALVSTARRQQCSVPTAAPSRQHPALNRLLSASSLHRRKSSMRRSESLPLRPRRQPAEPRALVHAALAASADVLRPLSPHPDTVRIY